MDAQTVRPYILAEIYSYTVHSKKLFYLVNVIVA